jgi:hypothetical protein
VKVTLKRTDRHGWATGLLALCGVVVVIAMSVGGYLASRDYTEQPSIGFGADEDVADRVEVTAWVTRIDVESHTASVVVADVQPFGTLAGADGTFAEPVRLETNAVRNEPVGVQPGESIPNVEQDFSLEGVVTDFPFDRYTAYMAFRMTDADGGEVPLSMTVLSTDAFFVVAPEYDAEQDDWLTIDLDVKRSPPTMIFGVFIMLLMLGLSFAAALAAYYVIRYRHGFDFNAYALMAALLFAMVPLRNAIPGNPPIGSVIDFMAFFIAEAIISISLIASVVAGYRHQMQIDRDGRA